jgi:GNAT superfamily N-acetyltransferase
MSDPLCITKTLYENFEPCCIRVYLKTAGTSKLVGLAFVKQEEKEDYWQEEKEDYWQEDPRNLYIKYICIKKNAHKKGIGSMLIEQIAQFFKARSIGLCVDDKETEKFYKKNNFIENNFTDSNNGNAEFYKKYPEYENEKDAPEDRKRKYCKRRAEELTQENPVTKKRRFETLSEEFVSSVFNFATPDSSFQPE